MHKKPNCYECQHRGGIPGDAHSCCKHPSVDQDSNMIGGLMEMLSGKFSEAADSLDISGDPHGIKMGWFCWPVNFDPVWLRSCNGFEGKDIKEAING